MFSKVKLIMIEIIWSFSVCQAFTVNYFICNNPAVWLILLLSKDEEISFKRLDMVGNGGSHL